MKKFLQWLEHGLSEALMGFLALAALALAVIPVVFDITPQQGRIADAFEWFIVALFAIEYGVSLWRAPNRRTFVSDPWRLLDLAIIVGPALSLLPQVSDALRSTPVLRLLRVLRAIVFGARAGGAALRRQKNQGTGEIAGIVKVSVMDDGREPASRLPRLNEFEDWVKRPTAAWFHSDNISIEAFEELVPKAGVPPEALEAYETEQRYPHVHLSSTYSSLFVLLPVPREDDPTIADRVETMLMFKGDAVWSVAHKLTDLHAVVAPELRRVSLPEGPFAPRMACAFLRAVLSRYEGVSNVLEVELRRMEGLAPRESSPAFFEDATDLKRELSSAKADLWRLKRMLDALVEQAPAARLFTEQQQAFLQRLAKDSEYLHGTVDHNRQGVISLIDLHLSIVSFDMNRFMRLLAAVSMLGLIPAVVGGLLGMNLAGNPWPFTLPQITFAVSMAMLLCLYVFLVKGFLR